MTRVSGPVLEALSENKLKEKFPIRELDAHRQDCTCTEAFARTLAGVAPWVELGPDATPEGKLREKFGLLARSSLINVADLPGSYLSSPWPFQRLPVRCFSGAPPNHSLGEVTCSHRTGRSSEWDDRRGSPHDRSPRDFR
jgi:hypothetical protein